MALEIFSKQELINYFFRSRQKQFSGGGNYLNKYKKPCEKKQKCGKKSST